MALCTILHCTRLHSTLRWLSCTLARGIARTSCVLRSVQARRGHGTAHQPSLHLCCTLPTLCQHTASTLHTCQRASHTQHARIASMRHARAHATRPHAHGTRQPAHSGRAPTAPHHGLGRARAKKLCTNAGAPALCARPTFNLKQRPRRAPNGGGVGGRWTSIAHEGEKFRARSGVPVLRVTRCRTC